MAARIVVESLPPYTKIDKNLPAYTAYDVANLYHNAALTEEPSRIPQISGECIAVDCIVTLSSLSQKRKTTTGRYRFTVKTCPAVSRMEFHDLLRSQMAEMFGFELKKSEKHAVLTLQHQDADAAYILNANTWSRLQHLLGADGWQVVFECGAGGIFMRDGANLGNGRARVSIPWYRKHKA